MNWDAAFEIKFEKPIELKKGKTYLLINRGAEVPDYVLGRALKHIKKTTGAKIIFVQGQVNVVGI